MSTIIHERVEGARAGTNPTVICQMPSGWAVLADDQFLLGYSILLPDPVIPDLNSLDTGKRQRVLLDMTIIGDALLEATDAYRINYEILGNTAPALHVHIVPRYLTEPEENRKLPVWLYDEKLLHSVKFNAERDKALQDKLAEAINKRI